MANISIAAASGLDAGTTSDDIVTLTDAVALTADETLVGNGGNDTLVLHETLEEYLAYTGTIAYAGATTSWTVGDADASNTLTLSEGFNKIQFADGTVIEAGVASSGIVTNAANGTAQLDQAASGYSYSWNGFAFEAGSGDALDAASIVSVDGQAIATVGNSFTNDEGAFEITNDVDLTFTPNATAVAAAGNPGETASFSYEVVIADGDGVETTITVTFESTINFSVFDDVWNATDDTADIDETTDLGMEDAGNDTFNGDDQINTITAGEGNDSIFGGDNDDVLEGGAGDDMIRGGNGDDTITVGTGAGAETDSNNLGGGAGADDITGGDGADVIFGGQGDDGETIGGLNGGAGDDTINGGAGNDYLDGGADNDELRGGDGDDTLDGDTGDDVLRGGAGSDELDGEGGDDTLYMSLGGDNGDDLLRGGADSDTFVLKTNAGDATIADFTDGDDILDVSDLGITDLAGIQAIAYEVDGNTVLQIDADTEVTLTGIDITALNALTEDDFTFAS
ncbi:calcium-binding protein [Phaeobacter italicus]|uniref:calcium-binding protein n=1 Tax=Phaeobacter italicus TaxID=481446 RepID=UPI001C95796F|nr:calcium-binding protein [Phaeobacter italicus]MBY6045930.1 hypothetical protein [Phaeobacter italicus]